MNKRSKTAVWLPIVATLLFCVLAILSGRLQKQEAIGNVVSEQMTFPNGTDVSLSAGGAYGLMESEGPGFNLPAGKYRIHWVAENDGDALLHVLCDNGTAIEPSTFVLPAGEGEGDIELTLPESCENVQFKFEFAAGESLSIEDIRIYLPAYADDEFTLVFFALALSVLASICTLYTPKIMSRVLDEVVPAGDVQTLVRWALIYCGLIVVSIVFTVIRARVMAYVSQEIIFDIRRDLFHHLQELPFSYYDSRPAGKILVRVINYVNSVSDILSNGIINSILEIINVAVIIVFMYSMDATLATVVVSGLPVFIAIVCILKPRQRKAWQQQSNKNSNYNAYLAESIDGVKVSQLFARQEVNCSIMKRLALACRDAWMKAMYVSNAVWLSSESLTQIVFSLLYIAGVYWLGGKMVSFGVILAMASYVSRFWQPITNLANIYNSFVNNIAYLERIFETMDEPVEVKDVPDAEPLKALDGEVTFENVEFGYEKGQTVLENLNLHVRAGERIHRGGQVYGDQPAVPVLQPAGRTHSAPLRRRNHAGHCGRDASFPALPAGHHAAGQLPVCRNHHGQHPLRTVGRYG